MPQYVERKDRNPVIGLSVTHETLKLVDERAAALGLKRAAFLRHAVLNEVGLRG